MVCTSVFVPAYSTHRITGAVEVPHGNTNLIVGGIMKNQSHAVQYIASSDSWEHIGSGPIRKPWLAYPGALIVKKSIFPKCN